MVTAGLYRIGPEHGTLVLRTGRQGLAAQIGHDLTIEVTAWSGVVTVADDPAESAIDVTAQTGSLHIVSGTGGAKPLSERDKREIRGNARKILDSDRTPEARFTSSGVRTTGSHDEVDGTLTLRGSQAPLRLTITDLGGGRYRASGTVVQSAHGIRPYTAFLGALKLADEVAVEAEVELTESITEAP